MNKISIFILTLTICVVCAEPPQYRQQRFKQFSRQEADPTTTEQDETTDNDSPYPQSSPSSVSSGPYAPSGWKPSGRLLVLPSTRQQQQQRQQQQYAPPQQYGTPTTEYGTPDDDSTSTAEASDSSVSNETTDEPESEIVNVDDSPSQQQANFNDQPQQQQPAYYVQLADGSVQRVLYVATANNGITAKLQAQPVVQAQPLFVQPFYVPQAVSFSSQYQSW